MGRVLIVDDEPDHCATVRAILMRGAEEVVVSTGPEEALQAAAAGRFGRFDVAVVDLRLPGSDGISVMHALQRLQPGLKVVILTAYPSPNTCRIALTEGASAYIEKPFSAEAFRALIASLLAEARDAA
ncbi:MAG: response regulator [Armatimonadetes bacterium]|nr:response regulator [Armatimonadota bacterium]